MISEYREDDGRDPGLGEMAYDGSEYDMDEFGERIGDDRFEDDMAEAEDDPKIGDAGENGPAPEDIRVEDGFGETLNTDKNPHLEEQLDDRDLGRAADADYDASDDMEGLDETRDRPIP